MIIDLDKFLADERPYWNELEEVLDRLEKTPDMKMDLVAVRRFHYLYQRTSADLAKIMTFSAEPEIRKYLEALVERAFGEIHETRSRPHRLALRQWLRDTFPATFRRHVGAFWLAVIVTLIGAAFGGLAVLLDPEAKAVIMPWSHLQASPTERVAKEESAQEDRMSGAKTTFSSYLMTHNTQVSIFTMALGLTWGVGTLVLLFYNGVILGAVALDYIAAGQTRFLLGWLLPHGSIEIPAILVAGQAGFILARALIGWGRPVSLRRRLREVTPDVVTLVMGLALFLVWAGMVEAFISQYHEPILPYEVKIGFGVAELFLLTWYLKFSGRKTDQRGRADHRS